MAAENQNYRSLPGRGRTFTHSVRLYQGPDHLLQLASSGYSETYKRFFYKDIQAMIIVRTSAGKFWNSLWVLVTLFFGVLALDQGGVSALVLYSLAAAGLLALTANIALGPTCACQVSTALQIEKLPSLKRVRNTEKVLAMLRPLIAAAQGEMGAEELRQKYESTFGPRIAEPVMPAAAAPEANVDQPPVIS